MTMNKDFKKMFFYKLKLYLPICLFVILVQYEEMYKIPSTVFSFSFCFVLDLILIKALILKTKNINIK